MPNAELRAETETKTETTNEQRRRKNTYITSKPLCKLCVVPSVVFLVVRAYPQCYSRLVIADST